MLDPKPASDTVASRRASRRALGSPPERSAAEFWSRRTGRALSPEELREIDENLVTFFRILIEWDAKDRATRGDSPQGEGAAGAR